MAGGCQFRHDHAVDCVYLRDSVLHANLFGEGAAPAAVGVVHCCDGGWRGDYGLLSNHWVHL
ncbi:hypothetical protein D9M71_840890 [compost metagenome]